MPAMRKIEHQEAQSESSSSFISELNMRKRILSVGMMDFWCLVLSIMQHCQYNWIDFPRKPPIYINNCLVKIVDNCPLRELTELIQDEDEKIETGDWETPFDPSTFLVVGIFKRLLIRGYQPLCEDLSLYLSSPLQATSQLQRVSSSSKTMYAS
jgi:hypothetical protein